MDSSLYQPVTIISISILQSVCKKFENFFNVVAVAAVLSAGFTVEAGQAYLQDSINELII